MGQDWPLTPEQIDFALQTVKSYSENWTALEKKNLKKDILQREQMHNEEKILIDPEDAPSNRFEDEENQFINDFFAEQDPEEPMDEETKQSHIPKLRWKWITKKVTSDEFKKAFMNLKKFKVIKFSRFFQSLFYFLGYDREEICEEDTNKLWWKKAKNLVNDDLFEKIANYTPIGPKDGSYKRY